MSGDDVIKIGSRKSELALTQTNIIMAALQDRFSDRKFEIVPMSTTGDKILDIALSKIGEKNLFTKELELALKDGRVDLVVHSLKDLPSTLPDGMVIAAVCKRENPNDAVVLHKRHSGKSLESLPKDSVIGTSSLRRVAQLGRHYPHLKFKDVRGNLNTRLRKLDEADMYSALVLATAGLERMGWKDRISFVLDPSVCMYAVGQGALAVEARANEPSTIALLSKLHDRETVIRCVCERSFLRQLEGGCSAPVAVHSDLKDNKLTLTGAALSLDGSDCIKNCMSVDLPNLQDSETLTEEKTVSKVYTCIVADGISHSVLQAAETLGTELAKKLQSDGATEILRVAKATIAKSIHKRKAENVEQTESRKVAKQQAADDAKKQ